MSQASAGLDALIRQTMSLVRGMRSDPSFTDAAADSLGALAEQAEEGEYPGKPRVVAAVEQASAAFAGGDLASTLQHLSRALITITR